ncbi:MAG TPA: ATP-dependent DNA ligase [Ignavibacteria bacterium]|jgi:DNA ligase-1
MGKNDLRLFEPPPFTWNGVQGEGMKYFAELFVKLDQTNKTTEKLEIIQDYLKKASDEDKLWVLYIFSGGRIKRYFNYTHLWQWANEHSGLPAWLFEECYHAVGDMAETIALVLPEQAKESDYTLTYWLKYIESLKDLTEEEKKNKIIDAWDSLSKSGKLVFNKLITGGFRVGVSQKILINALSAQTGVETNIISHRLMGNWHPDKTTFDMLVHGDSAYEDISKPYPFYLAYQLEGEPKDLGSPADWQAEWKWDGIRGQIIFRKGELFIWSRGEDLVTNKFPELEGLNQLLPEGTVIDGEILCWSGTKPLSFNVLQTRIGRKNLSPKILKDAPVVFMAYDVMEYNGEDVRNKTLVERRKILNRIFGETTLVALPASGGLISPIIEFESWDELRKLRETSREGSTEGVMLKRKDSFYEVGRKKGDWWKWKIDPYTIDCVMVYAQKGHGRRADLFTDYTFAVWDNGKLVTFAKAYSGLTDKEIREVDSFVKRNTVERFGPVRTVKPKLVFELAFEGIAPSSRHKSGVALRFPRIARWRKDKKPEEADTLDTLKKLMVNNK